jgi:ABC-2 type transport system permease protein
VTEPSHTPGPAPSPRSGAPVTPAGRAGGEMSPRRYAIFMAAALGLIFFASNMFADVALRGARFDLTEDHLYSLSDGAKKIVGGLAEPIDITLYYSPEASAKYPALRTYSARVREMLQSFAAHAHAKIRLREVNPVRFTDTEDEAIAAGIQPQTFEANGEPIYFGIAGANAVDERVAMPYVSPDREAYLEYEVARLISELETPRRVKVALITTLPVDPAAPGDQQPAFFTELVRAAKVEMVARGFSEIPADADELVILQPWALSQGELYAVDQFLMRKGRAFIAADPAAVAWAQGQSAYLPTSVQPSADLNALFNAWGINVSRDVVLDFRHALDVSTQDDAGRPVVAPQPLYVSVPPEQMARDDLITAGLHRALYFGAAGAISWSPMDGVIVTPLAHSGGATMRIASAEALQGVRPQDLLARFTRPSGRVETFAVRASGILPSAFGAAAPAALAGVWPHKHLARALRPAEIVIVADADFLNDAFYVSQQSHLAFVDNGAFALNAIDLLAGSDALVSLRSRSPSVRTLEKIESMRQDAQARMVQTEEKLRRDLAATETRLAALESRGKGSGFFTGNLGAELTPEERVEIEQFRAQATRVRGELRAVERGYRRDVDRLEGWLIALNVWFGPALIAAAGLALFWRRNRRAAGRGS